MLLNYIKQANSRHDIRVPSVEKWSSNFLDSAKQSGENSLFDIVLKSASLFDPVKFFLPNSTPKLQFLPKMTL
jgi:hypothetical protein